MRTRIPPADLGGFAVAAILAPVIAFLICFLGPAIGPMLESRSVGDIGSVVGGFLFLLVVITFWGLLPSLFFGGLVLTLIQKFPWRARPSGLVFVAGGMMAAALYVLSGLGVHQVWPGAAMMFAPWASMTASAGTWWVWLSLVLSGLVAGLIYARFAQKG